MARTAIIVGAGPAGLTAAHELLERTDIKPILLEKGDFIGGISRTVNYKGNRMDIGGHRFFSKSDRVMDWWLQMMPAEPPPEGPDRLEVPVQGEDRRMLVRQRLSRIYYLRQFFDYPVKLNVGTVAKLGPARITKIGLSYMRAMAFQRPEENSLEDFLINRFGKELYLTFFKDYTEKVWGVPCHEIKAEWGAQRIKGLSIVSALTHAIKSALPRRKDKSISQKNVETTLIEQFLYPKFGPGQLWEEVARRIEERGGKVLLNKRVASLAVEHGRVQKVRIVDEKTGLEEDLAGDLFFSTMPISELVDGMGSIVPDDVRKIALGLQYRDFVTAGLLVPALKIKNQTQIPTRNRLVPDNWIYVQERDVKLGRLQLFQNWSPYMVKDLDKVWIGLEYFCNVGDEIWSKTDEDFLKFAAKELASIDIIDEDAVEDGVVVRVEKTYPAYFGTYDSFDKVRGFVDTIENLFLVGRNGMHRYNNADHSMLTAMTAVDNIVEGRTDKANIWAVNTEQEYHEEKSS